MNNNLSNTIFTSQNYFEFRQVTLLNFFFKLAMIGTSGFAVLHFFIEYNSTLIIMNLTAFLCSLVLFLDLKYNQKTTRSTILSVIIMLLFFIYFIYINQNKGSGVVWVAFAPIYVVALLGWKKGIYISMLYFFIVFYMAFDGINEWSDGLWDIKSCLRLVLSSISIFMIVVMMDIVLLRAYEKLEILSMIDSLTGVYNRRKGLELLESEITRTLRSKEKLALILLDIDDFKKVNDEFGHAAGDTVLQIVTNALKQNIRINDAVCRWGGEEFLIIIPNIQIEDAKNLAQKLKDIIYNTPCKVTNYAVSCSFGVTIYTSEESVEEFINRADNAMYKAKSLGKNCVVYV